MTQPTHIPPNLAPGQTHPLLAATPIADTGANPGLASQTPLEIVTRFSRLWEQITEDIAVDLKILGDNPCDLGRARAIRVIAAAGRTLRTIQSSRIALYRLLHPGERIPRAVLRTNDPFRDRVTEAAREARAHRKIGRARELQEKAERSARRGTGSKPAPQTTDNPKPSQTGYSQLTSPQASQSPPVRSTGFSLSSQSTPSGVPRTQHVLISSAEARKDDERLRAALLRGENPLDFPTAPTFGILKHPDILSRYLSPAAPDQPPQQPPASPAPSAAGSPDTKTKQAPARNHPRMPDPHSCLIGFD